MLFWPEAGSPPRSAVFCNNHHLRSLCKSGLTAAAWTSRNTVCIPPLRGREAPGATAEPCSLGSPFAWGGSGKGRNATGSDKGTGAWRFCSEQEIELLRHRARSEQTHRAALTLGKPGGVMYVLGLVLERHGAPSLPCWGRVGTGAGGLDPTSQLFRTFGPRSVRQDDTQQQAGLIPLPGRIIHTNPRVLVEGGAGVEGGMVALETPSVASSQQARLLAVREASHGMEACPAGGMRGRRAPEWVWPSRGSNAGGEGKVKRSDPILKSNYK